MGCLGEVDVLRAVRVVVVDHDETSRRLLVDRLSHAAGIEVVGDVGIAADSLAVARSGDAEVVVANGFLADGSADHFFRCLRRDGYRSGCVVLAGLPRSPDAGPTADIDAFVLKELVGDNLEREIRRVGAAVRSDTTDFMAQ